MAERYPNGLKTLREKEKLLVTSNFSFSHSVFIRLVSKGHQKVSLCGNGLNRVGYLFSRERIKSLPHNPDFQRRFRRSLLKTLREKEKMLITSIFSFFPKCFLLYHSKKLLFCFQFWLHPKFCRLLKG